MKNFILGTLFGIVLATIGFTGITRLADRGVDTVKKIVTENAQ